MKKIAAVIFLFLSAVFAFAHPGLPITNRNIEVYSLVDGKISDIKKNGTSVDIYISTEAWYFYKGKQQKMEYEVIYTSMQSCSLSKGKQIKKFETVGFSGENSLICARAKEITPYVERLMYEFPEYEDKYWYFMPVWFVSSHPLSYRFNEDPVKMVSDFKTRLLSYSDPNAPLTIDHVENEDHVSFFITLPKYPASLALPEITDMFSQQLNSTNLYKEKNRYTSEIQLRMPDGTILLIDFAEGLDKYLKEEHKDLRYMIELYGNFIGYVKEQNAIIILIDEFQVNTDEQIIEHNHNMLKEKYGKLIK